MKNMHPVAFRKALIEAYLAGASSMYCGCYDMQSKADAREWYDNEYGTINDSEECDCCDDEEDD
jgi:hypothetical protein